MPPPAHSQNVLDNMSVQFGLMNALKTGNVILDMLVCMMLPLLFGGITGAVGHVFPSLRRLGHAFMARNEVTRKIVYERKLNQYGWTVGSTTEDNLLQRGLMLYLSRYAPKKKVSKRGTITLTEVSKQEQTRRRKAAEEEGGYDSDDEYGPAATLRSMEVSNMPSDGEWLDAGDGVEILRIHDQKDQGENDKSPIKVEMTTIEIRARGATAEARIDALVAKAFEWYKKSLEAEKDEKRYMYMMLRNPASSGSDNGGGPDEINRLYKRYELSNEKTFSSLFFPEKNTLLYLLDHFSAKTGKFAIPGFPHKLGILLYGPPGTGKTSLIKAIAHHTKRNIVSVPLSRIKTNQELMDVMFDKGYNVVNTQKSSNDDESTLNVSLDLKHTIFVMEDVDAASSVVQRRAPKREPPVEQKITTTTVTRTESAPTRNASGPSAPASPVPIKPQRSRSKLGLGGKVPTAQHWSGGDDEDDAADEKVTVEETTKLIEVVGEGEDESVELTAEGPALAKGAAKFKKEAPLEDDKLDLAGLLNVLDGVVDSPNRIVIMTTNHPEKLDPALIRPGRINKQILMGYLLPRDAFLMMQHYFGEASEVQKNRFFAAFQSDCFTPAQVEQCCAEHDTIDEFLIGLSALTPKEY